MKLLLINPNTNLATTRAMAQIAGRDMPENGVVIRWTAPSGVPLITDHDELREAAAVILSQAARLPLDGVAGVIIAAFGDPALLELREEIAVPVTGIAEAAMAEAACEGRFSIVTTTPLLRQAITDTATAYGHAEALASVRITEGDPKALMADPARLRDALIAACKIAVDEDGAKAIIIGGGPLAEAALAIAREVAVPLIQPIPAAVRLAVSRAQAV